MCVCRGCVYVWVWVGGCGVYVCVFPGIVLVTITISCKTFHESSK